MGEREVLGKEVRKGWLDFARSKNVGPKRTTLPVYSLQVCLHLGHVGAGSVDLLETICPAHCHVS